jgi:protein phosphatase 1 regulatory subunit 7
VRSIRNGWDGRLRVGNAANGHSNDDEDEDDDGHDTSEDESHIESPHSTSQHLHMNGTSQPTAATAAHAAIVQAGPPVEGEQIEADEDLLSEYDDDTEDIDLVHCRIRALTSLGLARFTHLQKLCLRQNAVEDMSTMPSNLASTLTELDLYDNLVGHIRGLEEFVGLKVLDLSFNKIKRIKRVSQCKELTDLYFVQNRILKIEGLEGLTKLRNLELGGNRLRGIEGLETLTGLEELWLGKNKITKIEVCHWYRTCKVPLTWICQQGLNTLTNLTILSIQSNRLTSITGLDTLTALEELHISHNALTEISGLQHNTNLRVIDISSNPIAKLEGLESQENLEELWASNCKFDSFEDVERQLASKEELKTVYFEGNPLQTRQPVLYRNKVRLALPRIRQIDASEYIPVTFVRGCWRDVAFVQVER